MIDQPPASPPAGWHDDPNDPTSLRYWDGTHWTDQLAPKFQVATSTASSRSSGWSSHRIVAAGAAGAIILGSVMPWATITTGFGQISANGTDGDGQFTIAGGAAILVLVVLGKYLASLIVSALTAAALIYDYFNISSSLNVDDNEFATASVGWGIQLATVAGIVAVIASVLVMKTDKAETKIEPAPGLV